MIKKSVFDIIGPIMIGPSSSHTAGAVKIGNVARSVLGEKPVDAEIVLYGSFAKTYSGHGTDRALVAGLLGMESDNPEIKDALTIAPSQGLTVQFKFSAEGECHPNTADITLRGISGKKIFLQGSSVGGGKVVITRINQYHLSIHSHIPTLMVEHLDKPGVVGCVTTKLGNDRINIAEMRVVECESGSNKLMIIETDQPIPEKLFRTFTELPDVIDIFKLDLMETN